MDPRQPIKYAPACFQFVDPPQEIKSQSYGVVRISHMMDLEQMLLLVEDQVTSEYLQPMEFVPKKDGHTQNFGFMLYR
jgi:hypothetical protein